MDEKEQYFISESIAHARSLSLPDCIQYLNGFISVLDEGHAAASKLRSIYRALWESDQQLDLIQIGQLKLKLESVRPVRRRRR